MARIARMPSGIHADSRRTIAEVRSVRMTVKGTARRATVMEKTIAAWRASRRATNSSAAEQ
jgi:hypothetical protein